MNNFSVFAEREQAGWTDGKLIAAYVEHFGPVTDEIAKLLVDRGVRPGQKVLDLCCGQGSLTALASQAGAQVAGLDFSPQMLALATAAAPDVEFLKGDAAAMPFDDGIFDAVVCNFGIMHLPDQPKALSEINRVLKPGGKFVMATWVGPEASPAFRAVFGAIKAHADFSAAPPQPDLFAFANPDVAKDMMAGANLRMTAHEIVRPAWVLNSPEELFDIFLTATVGAAMLIKAQRPDVIEAIRNQVTESVAANCSEGSNYRVSVPVAVVTAEAG